MGRYDREHRLIRAALLPFAYGRRCHLCGYKMLPGHRLHLDHTEDGSGYRGITHGPCNERDGAIRGNARRRKNRRRLRTSRRW